LKPVFGDGERTEQSKESVLRRDGHSWADGNVNEKELLLPR